MKKENDLYTGISQPLIVDEYVNNLKHPLLELVKKLRAMILSVDKNIGEGIFWNAPTFYFTGKMEPFNAKEYRRYIVGFNFYKQDTIRLVFLRGADADDKFKILEGDYKDGRRICSLKGLDDLKLKETALKGIIKQLVKQMSK